MTIGLCFFETMRLVTRPVGVPCIRLGWIVASGERMAKDCCVRLTAVESACVVGVEKVVELVGGRKKVLGWDDIVPDSDL